MKRRDTSLTVPCTLWQRIREELPLTPRGCACTANCSNALQQPARSLEMVRAAMGGHEGQEVAGELREAELAATSRSGLRSFAEREECLRVRRAARRCFTG